MNRGSLLNVSVLLFILLYVISSKSYPCPMEYPIAVISGEDTRYAWAWETLYFDGNESYDPDQNGCCIEDYNWVAPDANNLSGQGTAYANCTFDYAGTFTVKLWVTDNEGWGSGWDTCTIHVRRTLYVDEHADGNDNGKNWADAFNHLQDALAVCSANDEIWVADGRYKPDQNSVVPNGTGEREATFQLVNGVEIYGGFAGWETDISQRDWVNNESILSGNIDTTGGQDSYHVVTGSYTNETAVLDGFTITGGDANGSTARSFGGGMFNYSGSPTVTNCIFTDNSADYYGGGMFNNNSNPMVTNCIFTDNSADWGGGMRNHVANPTLTNCTFADNSAGSNGGGMSNIASSEPLVINCIFWGNEAVGDGNEIYNDSAYPNFRYCDIRGCKPADEWDPNFGTDGGGNIDKDPLFADINNPTGVDGIFGTTDDGLRVLAYSPCVDAADGNAAPDTDVCGGWRYDVDFVPNTGTGEPNYTDIGAYEYGFPGYITSFEEYQGFVRSLPTGQWLDDKVIDGWEVERGVVYISEANYIENAEGDPCYPYQYVELDDKSVVFYDISDACRKSFIRINCIPSPGSYINITNGDVNIASIKFGAAGDDNVYVLDNGDYNAVPTNPSYHDVAEQCRDFLNKPQIYYDDPNYPYSYENTWIDFLIQFDWANHTYDVNWTHYAFSNGKLYERADFNDSNDYYIRIEFKNSDTYYSFYLNRMSIWDTGSEGGIVEPNEDMWLIAPAEPDILNPLKGRYVLGGPAWYDKLGEYVVKCCPTDIDPCEPNNWMHVCSDRHVNQNPTLFGYWNTESFYNGSYFLKIQVYDDVRRLHDEGMITTKREFNGEPNTCNIRYPITGRAKGRTFHYEEHPDFAINWPGTFPFEFKRMYNNGMRSRLYPLFFGWTHNHNIRLIEDCQYDWIKDVDGNSVGDAEGLGVGMLWLCQPLGGAMFIGSVDTNDPNKVIYEPTDNGNHYIVRTSSLIENDETPVFDVNYVYYASDGMKMMFDTECTADHAVPDNEGLVGWMAVAGIDRQEDRFGNALEYVWEADETHLSEISNNRTPAKLVFTYDPNEFFKFTCPDYPRLCSQIHLYNDGTPVTDANVWFEVETEGVGQITFDAVKWSTYDDGSYQELYIRYRHPEEQKYMLESIDAILWDHSNTTWTFHERAVHSDDGTLKEKVETHHSRTSGYLDDYDGTLVERYSYDYDDKGNLITTTDVYCRETDYTGGPYNDFPLRKDVVVTSPEGALLSKGITTIRIDPCKVYYSGGGGAIDANYYYEDSNFPTRPTTIIEYFDDDGNNVCNEEGNDRPSRKTARKYDERGNVIGQKVYVDDVNYVYTELDYHQKYDFPVRQTTWQGYWHDEVEPEGRVEKRWFYGDANGAIQDGNSGDYLVRESTLLSDGGGGVWADSNYVYYSTGQIRQKTGPEGGITYYVYDSNGYLSKEWQGATLVDGSPIGDPQKRYYYDELGRQILVADYLGKVQMNVYDGRGRVLEAREYIDVNAVAYDDEDFKPGTYDVNIPVDNNDPGYDEFDWWQKRTVYVWYDHYDRPFGVKLYTGGSVTHEYTRGGDDLLICYYDFYHPDEPNAMGSVGKIFYPCIGMSVDGRPLRESRRGYGNSSLLSLVYYYDSMLRLTNKGCSFHKKFDSFDYITRKVFRYDGSGNKIYEAVYCGEREGNLYFPLGGVLEKENSYEYDILDRMTKRVVDSGTGGLNQTTKYGYDALGNRIYVIDPNGNVIFSDYDSANRKIRDYFAVPAADVVYDGSGHLNVEATKAYAIKKKEVSYYKNNKIKDVNSYNYGDNSLLSRSEYIYDSRGRIKTVTEKIDNDEDAVTSYDYNDVGDLKRVLADTNGYHIVITDANDKKTAIRLSYHGKPKIIVYPSNDYEEYIYYSRPFNDPNRTNNGLLEKKAVWKDGAKDYITYEYDAFGKMKKKIYPDYGYLEYEYTSPILGDFGEVKQITDYRDVNDRPGGDPCGTYTFDYWYISGKVKSYTDYDGYTVHYNYISAYEQPNEVNVTNDSNDIIYHVKYSYDLAGRLIDVCEPLLQEDYQNIAGFYYDENGNRSQLTYYRNGSESGPKTTVAYTYNNDNMLTGFTTTGGPTFTLENVTVDGLGRLKNADETISTTVGTVSHSYTFDYDMRSQLTDANITDINEGNWAAQYTYRENGDMLSRTIQNSQTDFTYTGNRMDTARGGEDFDLDWDENGQMENLPYSGITTELIWNWDGKLRSGTKGDASIALKYDPMGNRVFKDSNESGRRRYIVDISGKLPTILLELDPNMAIKKIYIYANGEILAQHDGNDSAPRYFYLHDRLGSVRQIIDTDGDVNNCYTYNPFGEAFATECTETVSNPFKFTGQYYDSEIDEYYLRARMYDPLLGRFTSRDPVQGKFKEPLTLHRYLYCINDPINKTDPSGEFFLFDLLFGSSTWAKMQARTAAFGASALSQAQRIIGALNMLYLRLSLVMDRMFGVVNSVWPGASKGPQVINNITYSVHALERMAPVGLGGHGVPPSVVENAILYGSRVPGHTADTVVFVYENVQVVMNTLTNTVITVIH